MQYDDEFPTCKETYATLRIFSDTLSPTEITTALGVVPSQSFAKGDEIQPGRQRRFNGWLLTTEGSLTSRDTRRHIDSLLLKLRDSASGLAAVRSQGAEIDLCCFWASTGQGGPLLSPHQMKELVRLDIEVWWDVYFDR